MSDLENDAAENEARPDLMWDDEARGLCIRAYSPAVSHFKQAGGQTWIHALYPRCQYCGLPMQFKGRSLNFFALQAYECKASNVVPGIAAQAEILESSARLL